MGKRKSKDPMFILQAEAKLLCDEATGHLKAANYQKALFGYNQVKHENKLVSNLNLNINNCCRFCHNIITNRVSWFACR